MHLVLTARDLTTEPEEKRELAEILPVVNILQTFYIRALAVRKIGLTSAVGTGDPDLLSGHQPACLFSPFAVTSHQ